MSTIPRNLLRQITGQTASVLKYSTLLFFTELVFLLYHKNEEQLLPSYFEFGLS